jgi:hypothetical protein
MQMRKNVMVLILQFSLVFSKNLENKLFNVIITKRMSGNKAEFYRLHFYLTNYLLRNCLQVYIYIKLIIIIIIEKPRKF